MYCKNCHGKITNDSLFCIYCGHAIKSNHEKNKSTYRLYLPPNMTLSNKKVEIIQMDISELIKQKKELTHTINLINESIQDTNKQKLLKEIIKLEKSKEKLLNTKKRLIDEIDKLSFQKEMLEIEINEMKNKKSTLLAPNCDVPLSLEYIDSLPSGLEFETSIAIILKKLNYSDVQVTSGSGDFGIDVIATKDDIKYGFQCKLYSNTVGNDAVQQAYAGRIHYNCNVVIIVTNNYFTEQAKKQALETQVILWDRDILEKKINKVNQI